MYKAVVEDTELTLCEKCSKLGKGAKPIRQLSQKQELKKQKQEQTYIQEPEIIKTIIPEYGQKIRKARTKLEMTQEDFARKINIKESLLQKMENSEFEPPFEIAEKLEKLLHIKLIEEIETEKVTIKKEKTDALTIGDLILKKRRSE